MRDGSDWRAPASKSRHPRERGPRREPQLGRGSPSNGTPSSADDTSRRPPRSVSPSRSREYASGASGGGPVSRWDEPRDHRRTRPRDDPRTQSRHREGDSPAARRDGDWSAPNRADPRPTSSRGDHRTRSRSHYYDDDPRRYADDPRITQDRYPDDDVWSPPNARPNARPNAHGDFDDGQWGPRSWDDTAWSPPLHDGFADDADSAGANGKSGRRGAKRAASGKPRHWWQTRVGLIGIVVALLLVFASSAIDGINRYAYAHSLASDGMRHIRTIQSLVPSSKIFTAALDPTVLSKVSTELTAAESDFSKLRVDLGSPGGTLFIAAHAPVVGGTVSSAALLASAADEACLAGLSLVQAAQPLQAYIKGGVFAKSNEPAKGPPLTTQSLATIKADWDTAEGHLNAAMAFASQADLSAIPSSLVSAQELDKVRGLIANWPSTQKTLGQVDTWLGIAPQLLGVSSPAKILMLLQDRSELRATGGFMGNYALITLQGGRIQPFHLEDTYLLDRPYTLQNGSLSLPSGYSWWPFYPFALRDANLSPNFPTSAQLEQQLYQQESGNSVGMVVNVTPTLVEDMIKVTGNLHVPGYSDVVTPANLESTIHKYQLGILSQNEAERKAFTAALGQALLAAIQKLTPAQQAQLMSLAVSLVHTKDIQIWMADKKAEALLATDNLDGSIYHGQGDAVTPVDTNIGGSKANQFVGVNYTDNVTIDAKGDATHHLTIQYTFHAVNVSELYGPDRYHTYLRVYVPSSATLNSNNGLNFENYSANSFGPSDVPGHHLWAGNVLVQDGQPYSVTLVWTVPHAAQKDASGWHYALVFQHQAGSLQHLALTISVPEQKKPVLTSTGLLKADQTFTLGS